MHTDTADLLRFALTNIPLVIRGEHKTENEQDEYKVIFNKPATILFVNGEKYISKAHSEDFDEEKGLLMCLAKANGISHATLKKLLKNAQRPSAKE